LTRARRPGTLAAAIAAVVVAAARLVVAPAGPACAADADPWLGRDKALHFGASATIAGGGYGVAALIWDDTGPRLAGGGALAAAAGLGKELYDLGGPGDASWRDLAWDAIGAATGLAIAWTIDRMFFQRRR
jgi:putative lipoprotein